MALFAAHALAVGNAVVINKCGYDVHMSNTPSAGGGFNAVNQMLKSGGQYSQQFTQLTNSNGWSLKLSKTNQFMSDILQYEYTFQDDGIIWFDLSEVNGNPWDGNWEITATGSCTPRQAAYRFATDDAYGMQSCPQDSSITVTLCSGTAGGKKSAPKPPSSPAEWSAAPATSEAPAPSSPAPVESSAPAQTSAAASPSYSPSFGGHHHSWAVEGNKVEAPAGKVAHKQKGAKTPTTLDTSSAPAAQSSDNWDGPAVTVTNMKMETITQFVTATAAPTKRNVHMHHPRHPHHRF